MGKIFDSLSLPCKIFSVYRALIILCFFLVAIIMISFSQLDLFSINHIFFSIELKFAIYQFYIFLIDSAIVLWIWQVEKAHNSDIHCVDWNPHDVNFILTGYLDLNFLPLLVFILFIMGVMSGTIFFYHEQQLGISDDHCPNGFLFYL